MLDFFDYAMPIIAALMVFPLWNTKYRPISLMFAADFVIFFGLDEYWLPSIVPGGELMILCKGAIYALFAGLYFTIPGKTPIYLALLSGIAGLLHISILTVDNYGSIMGVYCGLQYMAFCIGVGGGLYKSNNYRLWPNSWRHGHKGT